MTASPPATPLLAPPPAFFTPEFFHDPHPRFDALRARGPATAVTGFSGHRIWVVPGYEDVRTALTHPGVRKDEWRRPELRERHQIDPERRRDVNVRIRNNMINSDGPEHQRLRQATQQALSPARTELLRPRLAELTDRRLDALCAAGPGPLDLRADFTYPCAIDAIAHVLGLGQEERTDFRTWFDILMIQGSSQSVRDVSATIADYAEAVVDRRIAQQDARSPAPSDSEGLIFTLVAGRAGPCPLNRHELASTVFLLLIAGMESANALANGMLALLSHPEQLAALRADRSLLPGAIEETLRYDGSFRAVGPRYTDRPVRLGETTVPEGEFLLLALQAAHRDPRRYPDPHRFDITRTDHQHLGMGHGAHRCVGSKVGHAQLEIGYGKLLDRFPDMRLAVPAEDIRHRPSMTMNWLESLPVTLW
ncbi:cytochrome P450 [Streptomyces sp. NPDC051183]|uniref:cytochrome P450 n=1 Tax=Streptomyces sp. NPDC051183 TaxID=3155165 RepID=UPI003449E05B